LQVEIDKVNLFTNVKYEDIFRSLQSLANSTVNIPSEFALDARKSKIYFTQLEKSIDMIALEMVNLDKYVRVNCEGMIRLVSKFDKILRSSGTDWFVARLSKEEFCNVNFQSLFILLSLTWSKYRSAVGDTTTVSEQGTWRPPESFVRQTTKYWIKPENVPRLKTCILKHLPYLIFGSSIKDQEKYLDPTTVVEGRTVEDLSEAADGQMSETQLITSIYFDNTSKDIYRQRIARREGARLVRFRWYGSNEGSPDQEIFLERKVHHESWAGESSSKDRYVVKQKDVFKLMKNQYDIDSHFNQLEEEAIKKKKNIKPIKSMRELAFEIDTFIRDYRLQPFIRTCYYRCAFQLSTSNDVRISLDSQMSLINEFIPNNHSREPWCRLASDVLAEEDIVRFPYAILEVKLGDAKNCPNWVDQMLHACGAIKVQKFSKFLHAMAFLHPDHISIVPHWFGEFKRQHEGSATPSSITSPKTNTLTREERIENILISKDDEAVHVGYSGNLKDSLKDEQDNIAVGGPVVSKMMRSIEPKSIYANERTFIHYCHKTVFLLTVCIALRHVVVAGGRHRWVHLVKGGLAIISIIYLFTVYRMYLVRRNVLIYRARGLKKRGERLDIFGGPYMAAVIVSLGALVSFLSNIGVLE